MKFLILSGLFITGMLVLLSQHQVDAEEVVLNTPAYYFEFSTKPQVSARAYEVFDMETGEVLLSHNADSALPIASITKLFTAASVLDTTDINTLTTVTVADVAAEGRAGKLEVGEEYSLHELLFPLLLESSNDAATVFERTLPDGTLADRSLADGSGLSDKNQASARQLARSVQQLYHTHAHVFDITKLPQYVGSYTGWVNNSPVRDLPGYQGGKHGYTVAANRTLVAIFEEPAVANKQLGYILLGSDNLRADTIALRQSVADSVRQK